MNQAGKRAIRALLKLRESLVPVHQSLYFAPGVIFAAFMIASFFGWQAAKTALEHDLSAAASLRIANVERSIRERLASYDQILHGGVGLFQGSDEVNASEWGNYLSAFDIKGKYSGVQGIGFARVFSHDQLPQVQADMAAQGINNFQINPAEPRRDTHAAVIYVQTIASQAVPTPGFDMYAESSRRTTMLTARDTGTITITPRIEFVSNDTSTPPVGFNMYAPYYQANLPTDTPAQRETALRGYVFAAFRSQVFFEDLTQGTDGRAIAFRVASRGDKIKKPLYESSNFAAMNKKQEVIAVSKPMRLYGQTWDVDFALNPAALISDVQLKRPGGVMFFGVFSAVLISTIVLLLLRARARELVAQKEQAVELAKDELLSLASHQLRTPATGVKQYVGMVLQGFAGRVPKNQRDLLERAYASNDRQLRIINEILHLAKIDAGRIVLAKQPTNLNELLRDVINEQQPDIANAEHKLKIELLKHPLMVNIDAHMLRMAIENVLSNAIKYTRSKGSITIHLRRDRFRAYISIEDNGIGIETADLEKIFRQFSRLPNEMSQRVGGTGIGLYLAKHLVELHGGKIEVSSAPNEGSVFTIVLPLRENPIKNFTVQT